MAEDDRVQDHCNPAQNLHRYRGSGFTHTKCFIKRLVALEFTKLILHFIGYSLQIILPHLSCLMEQMCVSGGRIEKYFLQMSLGHCEMGLKNHFHQHVQTLCMCVRLLSEVIRTSKPLAPANTMWDCLVAI